MSLNLASRLLDDHQTCVIASVDTEGKPEAATVGFSHNSKFEILIGTNLSTRKYKNITSNPNVALVIGVTGKSTVQLEGTASEIIPTDQQLDEHYEKVPQARRFEKQEGQRYFLIKPTWLRLTDYSLADPIYETRDFNN